MNWQMFTELQANAFINSDSAQYYKYLKLNQPVPQGDL